MNKLIILFFIPFLLGTPSLYSQVKDTVYIVFDEKFPEMRNAKFFTSVEEGIEESVTYWIRQKEETYPFSDKFKFSHYNSDQKAYATFGGRPPVILRESKHFLEDKNLLDINFFRTTPYLEVCKTFEEEHSHEQDVLIFMADVAEMKNDSVVLREVTFSRPVKQ